MVGQNRLSGELRKKKKRQNERVVKGPFLCRPYQKTRMPLQKEIFFFCCQAAEASKQFLTVCAFIQCDACAHGVCTLMLVSVSWRQLFKLIPQRAKTLLRSIRPF